MVKSVKKTEAKPKIERKEVSIDVQSWDELDEKNAYPEIVHIQYSNGLEIRASDDEVYIDFQELPGHIKDQKQIVNVTRIYLTLKNARSLSEGLNEMLKRRD